MRTAHEFITLVAIGLAIGMNSGPCKTYAQDRVVFGVMGERGNPEDMIDARRRGITLWSMVFWWSEYEPQRGQFNQEYVQETKRKLDTLIRLGYKIDVHLTLGDGPPAWIWEIPHAKYKNQYDEVFENGRFREYWRYPFSHINVVFNPQVRAAMANAIRQFFVDFSTYTPHLYSVTTSFSGHGDSIYPYVMGDTTNSWWAFDDLAQSTTTPGGLAGPCPVPGWKPPPRGPRDPEKARRFYEWYIRSGVKMVEWQIQEFRRHFPGKIRVGTDIVWNHEQVTQEQISHAIETSLDGAAPEDIWRLAAGYSELYAPMLARHRNVVPHHTALEEITAGEVTFMRRSGLTYLSGENGPWCMDDTPERCREGGYYDGRDVMDRSFEPLWQYGLNEFGSSGFSMGKG